MLNHWMGAVIATAVLGLAGCACASPNGAPAGAINELKMETLTRNSIEFAEGVEVILSRVAIPAGTTLPLHYHPGQEFIYLLAGSGTLHLRDAGDTPLTAGDHFVVPYKAVHTFTSGPDGARVTVCRVHQSGQPERVPVEAGD